LLRDSFKREKLILPIYPLQRTTTCPNTLSINRLIACRGFPKKRSAARGYNGFLRWAYDAWPADPSRDGRHTLWPAGDCFLVYPGGNSSLRLEKLREGITDFEKIRILKQLATRSTDKNVKKLIDELNVLLQSFMSEHEFNTEKIVADMDHGRMLIAMLSDELKP
jgi:hypothetical protein